MNTFTVFDVLILPFEEDEEKRRVQESKGIVMNDVSHEDTAGTCPVCGNLVPLKVTYSTDSVEYRTICPEHGEHAKDYRKFTLADLGEKVSVFDGIRKTQS